MNKYYLRARLFPTVLTAIPAIFLVFEILSPLYSQSLEKIYQYLPNITDASFAGALIFLGVLANRFVAKEVFQNLFFKDEIKMPTTEHLLWKNSFFSNTMKEKIRTKIKDSYDLTLPSKSEEEEDELECRKSIITAVSQIRNSLRGNDLLLQHNIEYGFFRNLIGGSLIAVIISIVILVISYLTEDRTLTHAGFILFLIYLVPLLFSRWLIKRHGNYYSKILFEQFLSLKNDN